MKRLSLLIVLLLCAVMTLGVQAEGNSKKPGDKVTLAITAESAEANLVSVAFSFKADVFEVVSLRITYGDATMSNKNVNGNVCNVVVYDSVKAINGQIAAIDLIIKSTAPNGNYSLNITSVSAGKNVPDASGTTVSLPTNANVYSSGVKVERECPHENTEEKITKPATCEAAGEKQIVCECGEVISTEPIAALGHSFKTYTESKAPTCEEKGKETAKCERCDKTDTRDVKALGHAFGDWNKTKEPTCTEKGEELNVCRRCAKEETREISELGHDVAAWTVTKEATCEEKGIEEAKCTRCGEGDTREISALGHAFGDWNKIKDPTCTEKGEELNVCRRCAKEETRDIPELGHDVAAWTVTKEPTCVDKGTEEAKCTRCGEGETREVPALGHAFGDWNKTKEPTCTEKGEELNVCRRCAKEETRDIPELGHDVAAWKVTKEATCEEKGSEESKCTRCGEGDTREIPALGHNGVWKVIVPATGKEEGLKQKICKRCDEVLEEDIIPIRKVESRTACTAGIKASELTNLKADYDWWKMVTAIDLTEEGTNRYPLIAGNVYEIGYVEITIEDGSVAADLVVDAPTVTIYTNALIFLADPGEITFFDPSFYEYYEFPATINLEDLPAEKVYMMVCCQLTIDLSKPEPKYYNFKGAEHMEFIEQQNEIIK